LERKQASWARMRGRRREESGLAGLKKRKRGREKC
jgi:hypothetical protein